MNIGEEWMRGEKMGWEGILGRGKEEGIGMRMIDWEEEDRSEDEEKRNDWEEDDRLGGDWKRREEEMIGKGILGGRRKIDQKERRV